MPLYKVTTIETYQFNNIETIEADSEEKAKELALELFQCDWEQSLLLAEETTQEIEEVTE